MMHMAKQRGAVSTAVVVLISLVVLILAVGGILFLSYVSAHNYGNTMEAQLRAIQDDNRNIYAQYGQTVLEVGQVPEMYRDDAIAVTTKALHARYGEDGSKAVFQWIQEQNPNVSDSLYKDISQVIKAGRSNFENGQRRLRDVRRQYEDALGSFWRGKFLWLANYPTVDLATFDIVSTERADEAFRTKKEAGPIQLRSKPGVE